mgnify:FL=1
MNSIAALAHNANIISKAQTFINNFLKGKNTMLYVINPDGSLMEIQPGCTLLSMERYQMEIYVGGKVNDRML